MSGVKVGSMTSSFGGTRSASGFGEASSGAAVGLGVAVAAGVAETVLGASAGGVEPQQAAANNTHPADQVR